jgi:2',3'-cyclic-nucleotide 2'-phosphodiesterase (5'-nucleotidase family)
MIAANIDDSELPEDQKITKYVQKSIEVELKGKKIGIIGYVTPETTVSKFLVYNHALIK